MPVVNSDCNTIFDNVYLQTYALIIINVAIFIVLKYAMEEFVLPFLVSRYIGETYTAYPTLEEHDAEDMVGLEALIRPERAVQSVNNSRNRNVFGIRRGNSLGHTMTTSSANVRIKYTGKLIFVAFQFFIGLVSLISAISYVDHGEKLWDRYQSFYGFLLNTGLLTSFISTNIYRMELNRKLTLEKSSEMERLSRITSMIMGVVTIILLPPILTHLIPGAIIYGWVIVAFVIAIFMIFVTMVCLLESVAGCLRFVLQFQMPAASDKMFQLGLELAWRLLAILFFQTFFNYMYFFYGIHSDRMTGADYIGVIRDDYTLRTQTACAFHHAVDSFKHALVFFNWL